LICLPLTWFAPRHLLEDLANELGRRGNRALRINGEGGQGEAAATHCFRVVRRVAGCPREDDPYFLKANTVRWNTPTVPFRVLRINAALDETAWQTEQAGKRYELRYRVGHP
jgi:hypothetical protein